MAQRMLSIIAAAVVTLAATASAQEAEPARAARTQAPSVGRSIALAREHYGAGRFDEALRVLEAAREREPDEAILRHWHARLLEQIRSVSGTAQAPSVGRSITLARQHYAAGRFEQAEDVLVEARGREPDSRVLRQWHGRLREEIQSPAPAARLVLEPPPPRAQPGAAHVWDREPTPRQQRVLEVDRFVGDLNGLSRAELRERRDDVGDALLLSGLMTAAGALGILAAPAIIFADSNCRSGWLGTACSFDPTYVIGGLVTMGVSLVTLVVGAVWLAEADRYRRRLDLAMNPNRYQFDVRADANGGSLTFRGSF